MSFETTNFLLFNIFYLLWLFSDAPTNWKRFVYWPAIVAVIVVVAIYYADKIRAA